MKVSNQTVVSFHFTLKDEENEVLESSSGSDPLVYLHGTGGIVPGLEEAMTGRSPGDKFDVVLPPEKAYGQYDEKLIQRVPKSQFPKPEKVRPGMQFQAQSPNGVIVLTVIEITPQEVVVDGNPELAGKTLQFAIEVVDVRAATAEELTHGHAHGPGGHHH